MKDNRDIKRVKDIFQSINILEDYVRELDFSKFVKNEMMQSACIRHLEIIGEASSKISKELKNNYWEIPWREITALRNMVIHEYFRVDVAEIWTTIQQDLPSLKEQVQLILKNL